MRGGGEDTHQDYHYANLLSTEWGGRTERPLCPSGFWPSTHQPLRQAPLLNVVSESDHLD